MKLMKKTNTYKASNVTLNMNTMEAHSYNWWKFLAMVEGKLVFNNYRYSPSTGKQQSKVRRLLNDLGIKIDLELPVPSGLQTCGNLAEVIEKAEIHLCNEFLNNEIKREVRNEMSRAKRLEKKLAQQNLVSVTEKSSLTLVQE